MVLDSDDARRVVDAALSALLEQPGSGRLFVEGRELRFALKEFTAEARDNLIAACVPTLLERAGGHADAFLLTMEGLLLASDRRPERAINAALSLIAERYPMDNGRRQRTLLWSDVRVRGQFRRGDFDVAYIAIIRSHISDTGRPPATASHDPKAATYDYEFYLREIDLEAMYENRTASAWASLQRSRLVTKRSTVPAASPKPASPPGKSAEPNKKKRPLFVGSTVEALDVARELQAELWDEFEPTVWNQSLFTPGTTSWQQLIAATKKFDFAIFVFSGDDEVRSRGENSPAVRDNLLIEYGLFVGVLGVDRVFFLFNEDRKPKIASDLGGITALTYGDRQHDDNLRAALGKACTDFRNAARKLIR